MKEKADILIRNALVVTMDSAMRIYDNGAVAVGGGNILDVGKSYHIEEKYCAEEVIDAKKKAVLPGLIDCHMHAHQEFLRTAWWIDTPPLDVGWQNYLMPFEGTLSKEDAYLSGLLSCVNMIRKGTTCFADAGGSQPEELAKAVEESGVRAAIARSTADMGKVPVPGMENMVFSTKEAVRRNREFVEKWNNAAEGRIHAWFGIRQIMVCSEELWAKFKELATKYQTGIHTHLAEMPEEVVWALKQWGKRPVEKAYETGFLSPNALFAHMIFVTDEELNMVKERDAKIAHCPAGVLSWVSRPTKVPQMLALGITVGLGSDGGSTRNLDMFEEMMVAKNMHTGQYGAPHHDTIAIPSEKILSMVTADAAKALLWDKEIGSIEQGKSADIIILDLDQPHLMPAYRLYPLLVVFAKGSDVETSIINGRIVLENHVIKTVDETKILEKARDRAPEILKNINKIVPIPIKNHLYDQK